MKSKHEKAVVITSLMSLSGAALAHHGTAEELGGQLVHATLDPWHLGISLLVAGTLLAAYRLAGAVLRRLQGERQ